MVLFSQFRFIFEPPLTTIIYEKKFEIIVKYSKKKSSSVQVKNEKIIFNMSSFLSQKQRKEHFEVLLKRISVKKGLFNQKSIKSILNYGSFDFHSTTYIIRLELGRTKSFFKNNVFYFPQSILEKKAELYIVKSLTKIYLPIFKKYVDNINCNSYTFIYSGFEIKSLHSKWGHCSHKNDLLFNLKLLNAPFEVMRYVVCHELSHIKVKNHSPLFWNEVSKFCPNYKQLRKYLKEKPPGLFK